MAAFACLLAVSQVGCSIEFSGGRNRSRSRVFSFGQKHFRTFGATAPAASQAVYGDIVKSNNTINSTTTSKAEKVEPARQYSYEDGLQAGRNYVLNYHLTSPLTVTQNLPSVLTDADLGTAFEQGCREGINREIAKQKRAAAQRIRKRANTAPAKFVNPNRMESISTPIESVPAVSAPEPVAPQQPQAMDLSSDASQSSNSISSFVPQPSEKQIYSRPSEDVLVPNADNEAVDSFQPTFDSQSDITTEDLTAEPNELVETESPQLDEEVTEQIDSLDGEELDDRLDALFDKSRPIQNNAPQVEWQPAGELEATEELPVEQPVDENEAAATITEPTFKDEMRGQTRSAFQPYSAPKNSLRVEPAKTQVIEPSGQPKIVQQPIEVEDSAPENQQAKSEETVVLSATMVPFRRRSGEPLIESNLATVKSSSVTNSSSEKAKSEIPVLRARPDYKINNRIPQFRPSKTAIPKKEETAKTIPAPSGPPITEKNAKSVLINTMDRQKIELDPITKLRATPYSNLNSGLKANSGNRAIYQDQPRGGNIANESSEIFFVPAASNK